MNDPLSLLSTLSRPKLLVAAARLAAPHHRRDRALRTLLGDPAPKGPGEAVIALIVLEQGVEAARCARTAGYSVERHVRVLAALIAEGQTLAGRAPRTPARASTGSALHLVT